jgi:hypothetical protein
MPMWTSVALSHHGLPYTNTRKVDSLTQTCFRTATGQCHTATHCSWGKKVKLSLCLNWAPRYGGVLGEWTYSSTHSLTSALDGGEWSASRSGRFTLRERAPGTHWIGGWVGPRAVLDAVVKRKIPSPRRESNPRTPIVQPVAQRYTDWAITALSSLLLQISIH